MSVPTRVSLLPSRSPVGVLCALASLLVVGGCGGSSSGAGQSGIPGEEGVKPDSQGGGIFFVDPNQTGGAARLRLSQMLWGRLVDVHEVDASGRTVPDPVLTDFVIEPTLETDTNYLLERNPVTQQERLVIRAQKRNVVDTTVFDDLLHDAADALPTVLPRNDNGTSAPPFTVLPRNSCAVLIFDDLLDDDVEATAALSNNVRAFTGYTPTVPFEARMIFDPNHGAIARGLFHSTRVLVDLTVSEAERNAYPAPISINPVGLPPSQIGNNQPNVTVRIPTVADFGVGQFQVLTNLSGVSVDTEDGGPFDPIVSTQDVVRAFRSGNSSMSSNGFLFDRDPPRILGGWQLTVDQASDDPAGTAGLDFLLDITFATTCRSDPALGDVIRMQDAFLVVSEDAVLTGASVTGLRARSLVEIANPASLVGVAQYQLPYNAAVPVANGCWLSFIPDPETFPATGVAGNAQVLVRFSEPMDPQSLSPYSTFLVVKGAASGGSTARFNNLVVGEVLPNNDLSQFQFNPTKPYPHTQGSASDSFHVELAGATDLAGNGVRNEIIPFVSFTIASLAPTANNGSLVLRFGSNDEVGPDGKIDLRGQFFYDLPRGVLLPRPVAFSSFPVDQNNPVPNLMTPISGGFQPPLVPLGAKLQAVWRYADMGWNVRDETKYNLDVYGISWAPVGGQVVSDFYDLFEMRLGHSVFLPDELINPGPPPFVVYPTSGLLGAPNFFESNFLVDVAGVGPPKVVHNRSLGYNLSPADRFLSSSGTLMMPFPLNRGATNPVTYTWRDTAILAQGGGGDAAQPGIPLGIEGPSPGAAVDVPGAVAVANAVPSFGLPLLMEFKCFPSNRGLGTNRLFVAMANNVSVTPNFRAFTAGGVDQSGIPRSVDPDRADVPAGGFNPLSIPPGQRTSTNADNTFYFGQLDTVVRISRVHTVWMDAGAGIQPTYQVPVTEPLNQPAGTSVVLEYRSASAFPTGTDPFNAATFNAYGNYSGNPSFVSGPNWSTNVAVGNGARYLQVRITFVSNIVTRTSAELSTLALPFLIN